MPGEAEEIAAAGTIFFENISVLIFISGLFGVYILAYIVCMNVILQKESIGQAHKALVVLLLAGFVMRVFNTCAAIGFNLLLVKFGFMVSLSGGLIAQEMAANVKSIVMDALENWIGNIICLIADTAIIWRAWALWAENRLIKWTLSIILLLDISINIADSVVDTQDITHLVTSGSTETLDWLSVVLNLAVNVVATLLIAHRAWTHYQSTHAILHNKKTQVQKILLLMVESGAIFGVVQLANVIIQAFDIHGLSPKVETARFFLQALYIFSAALNPVALVLLIQTGNTHEHSFHLEDVSSLEDNLVPNASLAPDLP
ncbi:hypothetical protein BT96DRAFT_1025117 [Gymnopus androsaceus JB14]|uniref:Uncharacterized protein n=1 Tax=Gymnopus androsaceus JB14 TaxID=1447944 RepID=A0A6A4GUA3_9AGAR|nr:hypothetical protein BT96DRAFT_1025117 [Gymnopus androsaceus JB14]